MELTASALYPVPSGFSVGLDVIRTENIRHRLRARELRARATSAIVDLPARSSVIPPSRTLQNHPPTPNVKGTPLRQLRFTLKRNAAAGPHASIASLAAHPPFYADLSTQDCGSNLRRRLAPDYSWSDRAGSRLLQQTGPPAVTVGQSAVVWIYEKWIRPPTCT